MDHKALANNAPTDKTYLGDSVYAAWDGEHVILTTENGGPATNVIFINAEVWGELVDYIERLKAKAGRK